ncbi:hypothetical protein [Nesterenkonia xinjiangensis]|uniref:Uncharacterized protein n=1 Tax=Nesterenkonia xinjiangensis TaxID=225327 RepID=A0A7Z0GKU9_9MICC|nr:hypothetical protein [Nesterenkonia xinjiangensis]NYJ76723.1 hypothetical protein [Nesterenkonia xinjiangensis]
MVDSAVAEPTDAQRGVDDVVPGNSATFALIRRPVSEPQVRQVPIGDPKDLMAACIDGHLEVWQGRATDPSADCHSI